jgi:hypothetical protein
MLIKRLNTPSCMPARLASARPRRGAIAQYTFFLHLAPRCTAWSYSYRPARLFVLSCFRAPPGTAFCVLRPVPVPVLCRQAVLVHVKRAAADAEPASSDEAENDDEDEREEDEDAEAHQYGVSTRIALDFLETTVANAP